MMNPGQKIWAKMGRNMSNSGTSYVPFEYSNMQPIAEVLIPTNKIGNIGLIHTKNKIL